MSMESIMRRKKATALIDDIRVEVASFEAGHTEPRHALARILGLLRYAGLKDLEPCGGEAHSDRFIDNCMRCAPRWGFVGPVEVVS